MTAPPAGGGPAFSDRFDRDLPAGAVVGSTGPANAIRGGVDAEGLMGVDHGALRMRPLARPGWGREGIAYGPWPRTAGLTFAARVLNGHNSSQTYYFPETTRQRLRRIVSDTRRRRFRRPRHFENLAVGWFAGAAPRDPVAGGNAFVMHAANRDNGELWAAVAHRAQRAVLGVQNLDIVYVVALRERGAVYYAMSTPGAVGLGDHPYLRPLALDTHDATTTVYAGIHQRILGEVGYRVDTRVSAVCAEVVPGWTSWYGSASVADRMGGTGSLDASPAETGGTWRRGAGSLVRGAGGTSGEGDAVIAAPGPVGLVHLVVTAGARPGKAGLAFRAGADNRFQVALDPAGVSLLRDGDGVEETVAAATGVRLTPGSTHSIQVTDDGGTIGVHVDGRLVFDRWIDDGRDAGNGGVGVALRGEVVARDFEAHPREIPMPEELDVGEPWSMAGGVPVIEEVFDAEADDLHLCCTPSGGVRWERVVGDGVIELPAGKGARVRATREAPNPGRTIYAVDWDDPACADVELEMIPPGTARHQGENCRGGLVFWQDPDNYLVVNIFLDDVYDGASVSTFYHLGGHEDMYDAVWSLVWPVLWGEPCRVRVAFDGERFLAFHDGRPVLVRALTDVYPGTPPLEIRRIGIVVNREWGDDTGTRFSFFRASRGHGTA